MNNIKRGRKIKKNKSYKKILALTVAAALVGGNAVATFATESTTDTGVTASEDRILGDSKEKPIKVTFKMSGCNLTE